MAYEQRDNSGSLFRNTYKEKPNQPDHKGTAMIGGVNYKIAAWVKEGKNGRFFSLTFEEPQPVEQTTASGQSYAKASGGFEKKAENKWEAGLADLSDEIPF